jgi:hypothetical protein
MSLQTNKPLLPCPHIIACLYDDESAAERAFDDLDARLCTNAGVIRFGYLGSTGTIVAVCADDLAAAMCSARLPWGPGTPILLGDEACAAVAARRSAGKRLASTSPTNNFTRRNASQIMRPPREAIEGVQLLARNTDAQPWPNAGGICGAVCDSIADANEIRGLIVTEHLEAFEGMVTAFGNDNEAVAAIVADTPESNDLGAETLLRLAGNLDFDPDAHAAWELWTRRIYAGSGPFPITHEEAMPPGFLTGNSATRRVRANRPTRNQPCPCGSGSKYKRCCGR